MSHFVLNIDAICVFEEFVYSILFLFFEKKNIHSLLYMI